MSVREDKEKNSCSSGGWLAAAAIGVGVGAAVYYFLNKEPENPGTSGSTSGGWQTSTHALNKHDSDADSYTTVSEHSTTDTSINEDSFVSSHSRNGHRNGFLTHTEAIDLDTEDSDIISINSDDSSDMCSNCRYGGGRCTRFDAEDSDFSGDGVISVSDSESNYNSTSANTSLDSSYERVARGGHNYMDMRRRTEDTNGLFSPFAHRFTLGHIFGRSPSAPLSAGDVSNNPRTMRFRERSWTLEECAICFEVMLKDDQLMSLPCTHNFHVACIGPWIEKQHNCPVCRKNAE